MANRSLSVKSDSGNITGADYDDETLDLVVHFRGGDYLVSDVSTLEAQGFEDASSATQYYNSNLKNSHVVTKV